MNSTSATPLTRDPSIGLVWLDGRLAATVLTVPPRLILEIRPVIPPVYGPTGAMTESH